MVEAWVDFDPVLKGSGNEERLIKKLFPRVCVKKEANSQTCPPLALSSLSSQPAKIVRMHGKCCLYASCTRRADEEAIPNTLRGPMSRRAA